MEREWKQAGSASCYRVMRQIREIIAGKKCIIYADEQPQVLLIQPVGKHEEATLDPL